MKNRLNYVKMPHIGQDFFKTVPILLLMRCNSCLTFEIGLILNLPETRASK